MKEGCNGHKSFIFICIAYSFGKSLYYNFMLYNRTKSVPKIWQTNAYNFWCICFCSGSPVCRISLAGIKVLVRKRKDCNGQKVFRYARAGFVPSGMFPCNVQPVCDGRSRRKRY